MKKLFLAISNILLLSNATYAATIKVTECRFDEDDVNYCSKKKCKLTKKL